MTCKYTPGYYASSNTITPEGSEKSNTVKVIRNTPAPVTPPPTTYDLVGLTRGELEHITIAVGALKRADHDARTTFMPASTYGAGRALFDHLNDFVRGR